MKFAVIPLAPPGTRPVDPVPNGTDTVHLFET